MKCTVCGGELVPDVRDTTYTYKEETTVIQHVRGDYCTVCNEAVLSAEESRRVMDLMITFNSQVNSSQG